jgi:hypothetical protein
LKNKFYDALSEIKAEEQLKSSTLAYLHKRACRKKRAPYRRFAVALASCAAVFFVGLFSYNIYFTESAWLDIDVNPSIELKLNRFDRVVGVYAYNDDGQKILDAVSIRNKPYQEALAALIDEMYEAGYMSDSGQLTATIQMKDDKAPAAKLGALQSCIDAILQSKDAGIEGNIFPVDSDTKAHSHEQNLTPAKYLAITELQSLDPEVTFDGCRNHSISEINRQIHDHKYGAGHEDGTAGGQADTSENGSPANGQADTNGGGHMNDSGGEHGAFSNGGHASGGNSAQENDSDTNHEASGGAGGHDQSQGNDGGGQSSHDNHEGKEHGGNG